MKKLKIICIICLVVFVAACASHRAAIGLLPSDLPVSIPYQQQYPGNADTGYWYLVEGNYLKSGFPYNIFVKAGQTEKENYLKRHDANAQIPYNFTAIKAANGELVVAPNCLYCHAQKMGDSLIVGLGNSFSDYAKPFDGKLLLVEMALKSFASKKQQDAAQALLSATKASNPYIVAECRGVNSADRLTSVLASHRNPVTFKWADEEQLKIPNELIPTDVPAWWLLKKKNAMFYGGEGRGNFTRFLMASNLLTVTDTAESAEVLTHFNNVLAYLYSLQPPKYPMPINFALANQGKMLFNNTCSGCHGTYGDGGKYPNLLVPIKIIKTDSALVENNFSSQSFLNWFNKSWFTTGSNPAVLKPYRGYIAPPLDGVWCTAPYLHNGSVPNLETLLNSPARPKFWKRNFDDNQYNFDSVGWPYQTMPTQTNRSTYNTTIKGYGNGGHTFGDKFTPQERSAVIEYLKTL